MIIVKPSLVNPFLKTARAKEHLELIKSELDEFRRKPDIHKLTEHIDEKNGLYRVRVELADPPDRVAIISGDFFYCLRSSLDQLAFQLARINSRKRPTQTAFPILAKDDARSQKAFKDSTAGIPYDAKELIRSFQPYQKGDRAKEHLLYRLNRLCNLDKHERIPVHSTVQPIRFDNDVPKDAYKFEMFDDHAVVTIPIAYKEKMKFEPPETIQVLFGDYGMGLTEKLNDLDSMYDYVTNRVIPSFSRFFA